MTVYVILRKEDHPSTMGLEFIPSMSDLLVNSAPLRGGWLFVRTLP